MSAILDNTEKKVTDFKKEMKRLKNIISSLDNERDVLQQEVDEKAEKIVRMNDGLKQQEQVDTELKLNIEELEENLRFGSKSKKKLILWVKNQHKFHKHCL